MKIVFVIAQLSNGGAERVLSVIANNFKKKGHKVSIIMTGSYKVDYFIEEGIKIYSLKKRSKFKWKRILDRYFFVKGILKKSNPDFVIAFLLDPIVYSIFSRIKLKYKLIISQRNDPRRDIKNKLVRSIRDFLYNYTDFIVFQTVDARNYYSKKIQKKSKIILNPLKTELPEPYTGERNKEFVTVARLTPQKNLKMLIDAFKKLNSEYSEYILKIYGEGELKQKLENYIKEQKLNKKIFLKGFEKNVHTKILKSKAFVLTSDYEGISNSMLEAMAIGIPTICTDCPVGGAKMMINSGENGILVPVKDTEKLYLAMKKIIEDKKLEIKVSKNSVKIKRKLEANKICNEWEKIIREL